MDSSVSDSTFFFNDTATTEIYTLSLHDALPIFHTWALKRRLARRQALQVTCQILERGPARVGVRIDLLLELIFERRDRKSTRLNSSHANISYAVFCLKKKRGSRCSSRARSGRGR